MQRFLRMKPLFLYGDALAKKVKVTISLPEEVREALRDVGISSGEDMSKIIEDLLRNDDRVKMYLGAQEAEEKVKESVGGVFAVSGKRHKRH
mgnify:CR=1 FL=1